MTCHCKLIPKNGCQLFILHHHFGQQFFNAPDDIMISLIFSIQIWIHVIWTFCVCYCHERNHLIFCLDFLSLKATLVLCVFLCTLHLFCPCILFFYDRAIVFDRELRLDVLYCLLTVCTNGLDSSIYFIYTSEWMSKWVSVCLSVDQNDACRING